MEVVDLVGSSEPEEEEAMNQERSALEVRVLKFERI